MSNRVLLFTTPLLALCALTASGCSSDDDDDFVFASPDEGVIEVYAVDAPPELSRLKAVVLEIQRIQVSGQTDVGQDVTRTVFEAPGGVPLELDLLALRAGRMDLIARDDVAPAEYDDVILTISGGDVIYDVNGTPTTFSTDDGTVTFEQGGGWTIPVPGTFLDVNPGDTDQVVLDFDLSQLLDVQGNPADPTGFVVRQSVIARELFAESIHGVVRTDATTALEGAIVRLFQNNQELTSTKSDAQGAYAVQSIPPGDYEIRLQEAGFEDFSEPVSLTAGQQATVDVTLTLTNAVPAASAGN